MALADLVTPLAEEDNRRGKLSSHQRTVFGTIGAGVVVLGLLPIGLPLYWIATLKIEGAGGVVMMAALTALLMTGGAVMVLTGVRAIREAIAGVCLRTEGSISKRRNTKNGFCRIKVDGRTYVTTFAMLERVSGHGRVRVWYTPELRTVVLMERSTDHSAHDDPDR